MLLYKRTNPHSNGNGYSVSLMLADGDPNFIQTMDALLRTYDQHKIVMVGTAQSGEDFLVQAQTLAPEVVLIDLHLPTLGGLWTIPLLRIVFPETRIIILTPEEGLRSRSAILAAGGDEMVAKATVKTDLIPAIERVLRKGAAELGLSRNAIPQV